MRRGKRHCEADWVPREGANASASETGVPFRGNGDNICSAIADVDGTCVCRWQVRLRRRYYGQAWGLLH